MAHTDAQVSDPEIAAISAVLKALEPLDGPARERTIAYAASFFLKHDYGDALALLRPPPPRKVR